MNKPKKVKKVKAWAVTDDKGEILTLSNYKDSVLERIFFLYSGEENAKLHWNGFKILPCEITYKT